MMGFTQEHQAAKQLATMSRDSSDPNDHMKRRRLATETLDEAAPSPEPTNPSPQISCSAIPPLHHMSIGTDEKPDQVYPMNDSDFNAPALLAEDSAAMALSLHDDPVPLVEQRWGSFDWSAATTNDDQHKQSSGEGEDEIQNSVYQNNLIGLEEAERGLYGYSCDNDTNDEDEDYRPDQDMGREDDVRAGRVRLLGLASSDDDCDDDDDDDNGDEQEEEEYRKHAQAWIYRKKEAKANPAEALAELGMDVVLPKLESELQLDSDALWASVEREVRRLFRFYYRQLPKNVVARSGGDAEAKLKSLSLEGIAEYISSGACKNIVMVTGAGISTAAGIPDFRSPGTGLYHNLQKYRLPYPQAIFEIDFFKLNPAPFVTLAKQLYPGTFKPTLSHYFSRLLMSKKLLRRHYTQNIDTLERVAGIEPDLLVEAHGTFTTAQCINCKRSYPCEYVKELIFADYIPTCESCHNWIKPDIVFFGEGLPKRFSECAEIDFNDCDLLIVAGTSLKVQPFASVIDIVPQDCPRLLVNRELCGEAPPLYQILGFRAGFEFSREDNVRDVAVLGSCDDAFLRLAELLGWKEELLSLIEQEHAHLTVLHATEAERRAALARHDQAFYAAHVPLSRFHVSYSSTLDKEKPHSPVATTSMANEIGTCPNDEHITAANEIVGIDNENMGTSIDQSKAYAGICEAPPSTNEQQALGEPKANQQEEISRNDDDRSPFGSEFKLFKGL